MSTIKTSKYKPLYHIKTGRHNKLLTSTALVLHYVQWGMQQRTVFINKIRMLQRTAFINKIRMLQ
jgi:hypothetical protein